MYLYLFIIQLNCLPFLPIYTFSFFLTWQVALFKRYWILYRLWLIESSSQCSMHANRSLMSHKRRGLFAVCVPMRALYLQTHRDMLYSKHTLRCLKWTGVWFVIQGIVRWTRMKISKLVIIGTLWRESTGQSSIPHLKDRWCRRRPMAWSFHICIQKIDTGWSAVMVPTIKQDIMIYFYGCESRNVLIGRPYLQWLTCSHGTGRVEPRDLQ